MLTDGKHRIEQQHTLIGPGLQAAIIRNPTAQIGLEFLEDIYQRWRRLNAGQDGERQPMCLSWAVIRILSKDHDFRIRIAGIMKGIKDRIHIRIDPAAAIFTDQELPQLLIIRLLDLISQIFAPVIVKDFHR